MVRNMVREPPQNWSGDELVREMLKIGPGSRKLRQNARIGPAMPRMPLVRLRDAQETPRIGWEMPRIGPGATQNRSDPELVRELPGRPRNLSGRLPELVRELPGIEWPGPGISLGDAQNNQNWSGSF